MDVLLTFGRNSRATVCGVFAAIVARAPDCPDIGAAYAGAALGRSDIAICNYSV
jgi:hypothetical protein